MNKTKIEWVKNPDGTQGYTWNPITGCLNGCEYCYAKKLANGRLRPKYLANKNTAPRTIFTRILPRYDPFYPRFWEDRLQDIYKGKKGKGIFVCDMSDLFGIGVPEEWTYKVLNEIRYEERRYVRQNRYYLLTKQPQNLVKFSPFPDNCWVGVTATNFEHISRALYVGLARIDAGVKFISFEPLLGESQLKAVDLKDCGIDWVIIGAQTKPYKPPKMQWIDEIVGACDKAGVPIFLKDNLQPLVNEVFAGARVHSSPILTSANKLRQELPK